MGKEVRIRQSDCGQLRLHVGDEVTFYCILIGDNPQLGHLNVRVFGGMFEAYRQLLV